MIKPQNYLIYRPNYKRKLEVSTAPTKSKSREPAYSQTLILNKINWQGLKIQSQAGRQADAKVDGVWSSYGEEDRENRVTQGTIC